MESREPVERPPIKGEQSGWYARLVLAWMFVGLPLLWGISQTLAKALALFR